MKNRHLFLIIPPQFSQLKGFSTGLISIANYINYNSSAIDIKIVDLSAKQISEIESELNSLFTNSQDEYFIGITTTTANYQSCLKVAQIIKNINPKSVLILGGHHATNDSRMILQMHHKIIDFIILGEGEKPLLRLLNQYPDIMNINGLAYLVKGEYFINHLPERLTQQEFDSIPITFNGDGFTKSPGKFEHATYVSARGCPLKCFFCSVANHNIVYKSISQVTKDINLLISLGYSRISIEDNFFAHNFTRTHDLCLALKNIRIRETSFNWDCQTRVESLKNKNIITLLEKAGCDSVYIGVESFNPNQLIYLGKTRNPSNYLQTLSDIVIPHLFKSSINCYINLQVGLPGEDESHYKHSYQVLNELGRKALLNNRFITIFPQLHVVYPGTYIYHKCIDNNLFPKTVFETFTAWEYAHKPITNWLGEHFAHGTGGLPIGILTKEKLKVERYEIDNNAIFNISNFLNRISSISGIKVFNYGPYLIQEELSSY